MTIISEILNNTMRRTRMEVNHPTSIPSYQYEPVIKEIVKTTVKVLPKDGVEQTTVYTYDENGMLTRTATYTQQLIDKIV